ncbi:hypothetical protein NicSoilB8_35890 [Arthrobacter sp. NicSoilB8]|nr:hypothetical protein NicSoilB8_35890 [Arthrobacter sp. NicSoilB8]
MLNSRAGPKAGTAMLLRLKGAVCVVVIPFILGRPPGRAVQAPKCVVNATLGSYSSLEPDNPSCRP